MAITVKTAEEITKMRAAGRICAEALRLLEAAAAPGVSTKALDRMAYDFITGKGAKPSFLGYRGYPASINASVNNEVIHGIPGIRKLKDGDILSVDVGVCLDGFHADAARTFAIGNAGDEAAMLIQVTRDSFYEGMKFARAGMHVYEISAAVQRKAEANGCSVVRDFTGHGIGRRLHEPPDIPNYKPKGRGAVLAAGMTIAVEPMVNLGGWEVIILDDGWTVVTKDVSLSAHYENTVLITDGEPELLTV